MKIVLATNNPHKQEKLAWIVAPFFDRVKKPRERLDIEETGNTFVENAEIKAIFVANKYNCYAIATDGGVLIPALGKNWNALLTKRFAGKEHVTDFERMDTLLDMMKRKRGDERKLVWKEALAIALPGRVLFSTEVTGDTAFLQYKYDPKQYKKGIWLCTLSCYPQFGNKNFFELNFAERKYSERSWWKLRNKMQEYLRTKWVNKG